MMEPPTPLTPKVQSLTSNVPPIPAPDVTRIDLRTPPKPAPKVYDIGDNPSDAWMWLFVTALWVATVIAAFALGGKLL